MINWGKISQNMAAAMLLCALGWGPPHAAMATASKASTEASFTAFEASVEKTKDAMMGDPEEALKIALNAV
ncbi:MAG: hypothetical protein U5J78_00635 [Parasphingorhabdus sp.]|nr:hypothetical protein [Parasphingorhabdus sp.]